MGFNHAAGTSLASLFSLLAEGEALAARAAREQAEFCSELRQQRFFRAQARQEQFHHLVFGRAAAFFGGTRSSNRALAAYVRKVEHALQNQALFESVIAVQVVLEGLGEVMLKRLDAGIAKRGLGFTRLRRLILEQEKSHHRFGESLIVEWQEQATQMRCISSPYLDLVDEVIDEAHLITDFLHLDPAILRTEVRATLPQVLR